MLRILCTTSPIQNPMNPETIQASSIVLEMSVALNFPKSMSNFEALGGDQPWNVYCVYGSSSNPGPQTPFVGYERYNNTLISQHYSLNIEDLRY